MTTLATLERWLDAHVRHDVDTIRMAFSLVGEHPKRGEKRAYDAMTRQVPENPDSYRKARIEHVPGTQEEFYLYIVQGKCEDRLTLTRNSLGRKKLDDEGLSQALHAILGDPPGWPRRG